MLLCAETKNFRLLWLVGRVGRAVGSGHYVNMRGLPWSATEKEIVEVGFFQIRFYIKTFFTGRCYVLNSFSVFQPAENCWS